MSEQNPLTIEYAAFYKKQYQALLDTEKTPIIDLTGIQAIDVSGIQILVALVREASKQKKELHFTGSIHENVSLVLENACMTNRPCTNGEQLEDIIKAVF